MTLTLLAQVDPISAAAAATQAMSKAQDAQQVMAVVIGALTLAVLGLGGLLWKEVQAHRETSRIASEASVAAAKVAKDEALGLVREQVGLTERVVNALEKLEKLS